MSDTQPLPSTHTTIDADALGHILIDHYSLAGNVVCELLHRGMNDFYLLRGRDRNLVAQVWRPMTRSEDDVTYEMEFLDHLFEGGVKVPKPHWTEAGDWMIKVKGPEGIRPVAVFDFVPGRVFSSRPEPAIARKMGEIFARIHILSESFDRERYGRRIDRAAQIKSSIPALESLVEHRPSDLNFYREISDALHLVYLGAEGDPSIRVGATHGDFHIHNAFVSNEGEVTIMDFDACGIDYYVQELMSYRWSVEKNNLPMLLWEDFLSAYIELRPLTESEFKYIPAFLVGKEFSYLCGFSHAVNAIGHVAFHFPGLDWFAKSLRRHVKDAALI